MKKNLLQMSSERKSGSILYSNIKNNHSTSKISLFIALAFLACHYCFNLKVVPRDTACLHQRK